MYKAGGSDPKRHGTDTAGIRNFSFHDIRRALILTQKGGVVFKTMQVRRCLS
jgi:hypothetical protein